MTGRKGKGAGNGNGNRVNLAYTMRGMRHVGETAWAVTQAGGAVWAGAVMMRAEVPWEPAIPLPHMHVHW